MKRIILLLLSSFIVVGCHNEESDYQKAIGENSLPSYQQFLEKYPASEYAPEIRYRAAMVEGSLDALVDFLGSDKNVYKDEWMSEALDSARAILKQSSDSVNIAIWEYSSNYKLRDWIENNLFERNDSSAWLMVEHIASNKNRANKERTIAYDKYINLYKNGLHAKEARENKKLIINKIKEDSLLLVRNALKEAGSTYDIGSAYSVGTKTEHIPVTILGHTVGYTTVNIPTITISRTQSIDRQPNPEVKISEVLKKSLEVLEKTQKQQEDNYRLMQKVEACKKLNEIRKHRLDSLKRIREEINSNPETPTELPAPDPSVSDSIK